MDPSLAAENEAGKSNAELVALTLANQENFLYIVNRYKNRLTHYIQRLTNVSADEVEDILQMVFIKVYLNLNDFDTDLKFSSWIYRITHNQVISNHRKIKARPQSNGTDLEDQEVLSLAADIDIEKDADAGLQKKKIAGVLRNMKGKYRELLILKFFEDKSYQEISDIIEKPPGTVASMMNKAKKEFKCEFAKQKITL